MKTLRLLIPLLLLITVAHAAAPEFYVTGQIGAYHADAGTVEGLGFDSIDGQSAIKSGTQSFHDFAVGADLSRWFSVEVGYAHFDSFTSPLAETPTGSSTSQMHLRQVYRPQSYRLTPSIRVPLGAQFELRFMGGLTRSEVQITTLQYSSYTTNRGVEVSNVYPRTADYATNSYHLGLGLVFRLSEAMAVEGRFMHYEFGRMVDTGIYRRTPVSGNRIDADTFALGLSWRFAAGAPKNPDTRMYVAAQIGLAKIDAGTTSQYSSLLTDAPIKSGARIFRDFSIGIDALDWLSVEAGYADFSGFASGYFAMWPGVTSIVAPPRVWQTYDIHSLRLTPVVTIFSNSRFALRFLGGPIYSGGKVAVHSDYFDPRFPDTTSSVRLDKISYHLGLGGTFHFSKHASLDGRILRYDFGKPDADPNRITALTYSLGLSWGF